MSRTRLNLLAVVGVFVALLASLSIAEPAMAASSCYGDYCSGQDPATTGVGGVPCANDGKVVATSRVKVDYYHPGGDPFKTTKEKEMLEIKMIASYAIFNTVIFTLGLILPRLTKRISLISTEATAILQAIILAYGIIFGILMPATSYIATYLI